MLSTAVSILAATALLMPGFIIAELSVARSARLSRSDLELALRALTLEAPCEVEVDDTGIRNLAERVNPERGVYIAASQIARVDLVPEGPATLSTS